MACEDEVSKVGAALTAAIAVCGGLEELPIAGQIACLAALWTYYNEAEALDRCLQQNNLVGITDHVQGIYQEATALQQHTDQAQATA